MVDKVYNEASKVDAEEGVVYVDGPDGVSVALTPEAAIETSDMLLEQGAKSHGQNVQAAQDARAPGKSGSGRNVVATRRDAALLKA